VGVNTLIVDDGKNGFVCEDPASWESKLTDLLTNSALRQEMGIAARRKIEANYSVVSSRDQFFSLFS
jgi:glycosyltransferase involved in cell wall biosynthesis